MSESEHSTGPKPKPTRLHSLTTRLTLLYALGSVVTLGGGYAIADLIDQHIEAALAEPRNRVMVMVAAKELSPGETIREEWLYAVEMNPKFLPAGVYWSHADVVGRTVAETILTHEYIRSERLTP